MQPRGLTGLAFDTLATSTSELRSILHLLAEDKYPILIHCTQGKDRTGLVVLLVLLVLEVPVADIVADYRASEGELQVEMEERISELRKGGLGMYLGNFPFFVGSSLQEVKHVAGIACWQDMAQSLHTARY